MFARLTGSGAAVLRWATLALMFALATPVQAQTPGPFTQISGSWSGNGNITFSNNSRERIRCRASFDTDGAGTNVKLSILCASDSYKFELRSNVTFQNGGLAGTWDETTRHVGGNVSGAVDGNVIDVRANGQTFTALLTLTVRGSNLTISIRSPGSTMSEALISLTRGK